MSLWFFAVPVIPTMQACFGLGIILFQRLSEEVANDGKDSTAPRSPPISGKGCKEHGVEDKPGKGRGLETCTTSPGTSGNAAVPTQPPTELRSCTVLT